MSHVPDTEKIQRQTEETIFIEKNVKSPDKSDPVLQFNKKNETLQFTSTG